VFPGLYAGHRAPNAELFAQFQCFGELALGLTLVLNLLTTPAAVGSILLT
jgi:hypothetical protein